MALVATEDDEVEVLALLVAFKAVRHGGTSSLHSDPSQNVAKDRTPKVLVLVEMSRVATRQPSRHSVIYLEVKGFVKLSTVSSLLGVQLPAYPKQCIMLG